jgi:hypothetical protein
MAVGLAVEAGSPPPQPWANGVEKAFESRIGDAELAWLKHAINMSAEESAAVDGAFEKHRASFAEFTSEYRPVADEWKVKLEGKMEIARLALERAESNIVQRIESVLTPEQLAAVKEQTAETAGKK